LKTRIGTAPESRTNHEGAMLFPCCSEQLVASRNGLILLVLAGGT
jgi:hypothetical protein